MTGFKDALAMVTCQHKADGIEYGAVFDASNAYRYLLWRAWSAYHARIAFVLLNPSTANEEMNDPTIRRCIGFARHWKFGSVEVVNVFAYRATDARELFKVDDPIGEENNDFLIRTIERCSAVVVGWGVKGTEITTFCHCLLTGTTSIALGLQKMDSQGILCM